MRVPQIKKVDKQIVVGGFWPYSLARADSLPERKDNVFCMMGEVLLWDVHKTGDIKEKEAEIAADKFEYHDVYGAVCPSDRMPFVRGDKSGVVREDHTSYPGIFAKPDGR